MERFSGQAAIGNVGGVFVSGTKGSAGGIGPRPTVSAYDSAGTHLWTFVAPGTDQLPPTVSCGTPVLGEAGNVYAACGDAKLYCLDAESGAVEWEYDGVVPNSPVITEDGVLISHSLDGVVAVRVEDRGLESAPWPRFRGSNQSTGRVN